jgi:Ni,Fe-hydrogenase III small subunit
MEQYRNTRGGVMLFAVDSGGCAACTLSLKSFSKDFHRCGRISAKSTGLSFLNVLTQQIREEHSYFHSGLLGKPEYLQQ